jgi:predicted nucleotidyltransferase
MSRIQRLAEKGLIHPPKFLPSNVHYEVIVGSEAYGVSSGGSDMDITAWCIPPKQDVFPHLRGEIQGFGTHKERFTSWQEHHIDDPETRKEYDLNVYSIVKFFNLCLANNPNIVDILFTPQRCVLHCTRIASMVRERRHIFLSKKAWHTYKGYSYEQLHKMDIKNPKGKRKAMVDEFGYDLKFAYHVVRLLLQVEQILAEETLDLERNREVLKAIRRGEWGKGEEGVNRIRQFFQDKEVQLEKLYQSSHLRWAPDEEEIKTLLLECLEEHYGDLSSAVVSEKGVILALRQVTDVVDRSRHLIGG